MEANAWRDGGGEVRGTTPLSLLPLQLSRCSSGSETDRCPHSCLPHSTAPLMWPCGCCPTTPPQKLQLTASCKVCVAICLESGFRPLSFFLSFLVGVPLFHFYLWIPALYCLTSFSPSSLSLGPWQLLSQCCAPRDSGRGGWVERGREKWNGGKNGSRRTGD